MFESIGLDTTGEIIYEPIKIAVFGKNIFLEVHEYIYGFIPNMEKETVRKLSDLGLIQDVDLEKLKEGVRKAQGVPVRVSIH